MHEQLLESSVLKLVTWVSLIFIVSSSHYSFYVTLVLRSADQYSLHREESQTLIPEVSESLMVLPLLDQPFLNEPGK